MSTLPTTLARLRTTLGDLPCPFVLKEVMAMILFHQHAQELWIEHADIECDEDSVSVSWTRYHFTLDVYLEEEKVVMRVVVRHKDAKDKWQSTATVFDGAKDGDIEAAANTLSQGFQRATNKTWFGDKAIDIVGWTLFDAGEGRTFESPQVDMKSIPDECWDW